MGTKNLILLLLLVSVLLSGCLSSDEKPEGSEVLEETGTSGAEVADEKELSVRVNETEIEGKTAAKVLNYSENLSNPENLSNVEEVETSKRGPEILGPDESEPATYMVRLEKHLMIPQRLEIKTGDTVAWRNFQKPKRYFTLVSEDDLFENRTLEYGRPFTCIFNESGKYNFSIVGKPRMKMTITVK